MSSPRAASPSDAVIACADRPVGAVLLPEVEPEAFIEEFNRIYASIGLVLSKIDGLRSTL